MNSVTPLSVEELAATLKEAAANRHAIETMGNHSKLSMGGPVLPADISICTAGLKQVLQYEPNDLTISVEAGLPFTELQALLARNRQMIALDPPFAATATVGGIVATNSSGPLRRAFGTARDLLIGMRFATLDGRLVTSGGMVGEKRGGAGYGEAADRQFWNIGGHRQRELPPAPDTGRDRDICLLVFRSRLRGSEAGCAQSGRFAAVGSGLNFSGSGRALGIERLRSGSSRRGKPQGCSQGTPKSWRARNGSPAMPMRHGGAMSASFSSRLSTAGARRYHFADFQHDLGCGPAATHASRRKYFARGRPGVTYAYLTSDQQLSSVWESGQSRRAQRGGGIRPS